MNRFTLSAITLDASSVLIDLVVRKRQLSRQSACRRTRHAGYAKRCAEANDKEIKMDKGNLGDMIASKAKEVDPFVSELSIFKQLIKERVHPLDLVRELLSNSGAREVNSKKIEISYTKDKEGHIFEISDDGCGMNYTGNNAIPGRLDRFLGLGLSGIIGMKHDEFSWKGLGSKLSYQSRRVEVETCAGENHPLYDVRINEPWETISHNRIPKPRISEHPSDSQGTKIRVIGHPPHRHDEPFTFDTIRHFLSHRTFAGYTGQRDVEPKIVLSVLGRTESIPFGFPEFHLIDFGGFAHEGLQLKEDEQTLYINMCPKKGNAKSITLKGIITWDATRHNLSSDNLNTGLILSVKGIPYFKLNMEEYGVSTIRTARPGENKCCLVVECDWIQDEMNISRCGLVDSPKAVELRKIVSGIFQRIESSPEYLTFRRLPERDKFAKQSGYLSDEKKKISDQIQNWIVYAPPQQEPVVLVREPQNEQEVNILIWKLEALNALPFKKFKTLAYIGAAKGPDILVNYQEEEGSEPQLATVVEIENNFYNYKSHGHMPSQYPKVVCWDIPSSGRKAKLNKTSKRYKYTHSAADFQVHVFVLKLMDNIKIMSRQEVDQAGIDI